MFKNVGSIPVSCLLVVLVILAGGCGSKTSSGTSSTSPATSSSGGPGNYLTSFADVDLSLQLPVAADATTAEIESYIAEASAKAGIPVEPHTVALLSLDNRSKTATRSKMFSISLVNTDKSQLSSEEAWAYIGTLQQKVPSSDESGFYNQGVDLYNKLIAQDDVMPGAKASSYIVFKTADVSRVKAVFVSSFESPGTKEMKKQS
jgi:hypothetical protein